MPSFLKSASLAEGGELSKHGELIRENHRKAPAIAATSAVRSLDVRPLKGIIIGIPIINALKIIIVGILSLDPLSATPTDLKPLTLNTLNPTIWDISGRKAKGGS